MKKKFTLHVPDEYYKSKDNPLQTEVVEINDGSDENSVDLVSGIINCNKIIVISKFCELVSKFG